MLFNTVRKILLLVILFSVISGALSASDISPGQISSFRAVRNTTSGLSNNIFGLTRDVSKQIVRRMNRNFIVKKIAKIKRGYLSFSERLSSDYTTGIEGVATAYGDMFENTLSQYDRIVDIVVSTTKDFFIVTVQSFKDTGKIIKKISSSTVLDADILIQQADLGAGVFSDMFYENVKNLVNSVLKISFVDILYNVRELSNIPLQANIFEILF